MKLPGCREPSQRGVANAWHAAGVDRGHLAFYRIGIRVQTLSLAPLVAGGGGRATRGATGESFRAAHADVHDGGAPSAYPTTHAAPRHTGWQTWGHDARRAAAYIHGRCVPGGLRRASLDAV